MQIIQDEFHEFIYALLSNTGYELTHSLTNKYIFTCISYAHTEQANSGKFAFPLGFPTSSRIRIYMLLHCHKFNNPNF